MMVHPLNLPTVKMVNPVRMANPEQYGQSVRMVIGIVTELKQSSLHAVKKASRVNLVQTELLPLLFIMNQVQLMLKKVIG